MSDKVHELMSRAEELPYGEARTVLTEEALRYAEADGDRELIFRVRLRLTSAYRYGGETAKTLTTFSRCLADFDAAPGAFPDTARQQLLWDFKGIVNALTQFPEVPLDRTYAVLDDMERRYRAAGYGLHAVYACRTRVAQHLGDAGAAADWYARWHAAPRDLMSDCAGCDPTSKVDYLAWQGAYDEAVAVAEPVLAQQLTCIEQPQMMLTSMLPIYLSAGLAEQARDAHRRAYRAIRTELADLDGIATHIEFCARSGNEARGLEIVERHHGWLEQAPTPHAAMRFAAASALLRRRAGLPYEGLRQTALDLAARFDARNGTSHQGDLTRETLDAEPVVERLPLTPHASRPAPPPPPAEPIELDDPEALLDAAEEHWRHREVTAALAAWHRFDALAAESARRVEGLGYERLVTGDVDGALECWDRAVRMFTEDGDEARRQNLTGRIAALRFREHGDAAALAAIESTTAHLAEHGTPRQRTNALLRLADALIEAGRPDDALRTLNRIDTDTVNAAAGARDATENAAGAPDAAENAADAATTGALREAVGDAADVDKVRFQAFLRLGDQDAAVDAIRRAVGGFRAAGGAAALAEASLRLGQLVEGEEAFAAFSETIAVCPAEHEALRLAGYALRGDWLVSADRSAEAVEDLIEAVAGFTAAGSYPQAAYARRGLCAAYYNTGRHLEAAETAEEAIPMLERLDDPHAANGVRFVLAHAQRELGEAEQAAATFASLAASDAERVPAQSAGLLETAGGLLSKIDKDVLAADRYAEAAALYQRAGEPLAAVAATRHQAVCLFYAGDPTEALRILETLDPPGDDDPTTWERAALAFEKARIQANTGDLDQAAHHAETAHDLFAALNSEEALAAAEGLLSDIRQED